MMFLSEIYYKFATKFKNQIMKTKIKLSLAGILFAGVLSVNAQIMESSDRTGLGIDNGAFLTGGVSCTTIGFEAGFNIEKDAANNTFVGHQSGKSNTLGSSNAFFGSQSGINNTTGINNTFLGYFAGYTNQTGGENVFVGFGAGSTNNGSWNTFVGRSSGNSNTTGYDNNFFGGFVGFHNTTGIENSFFGTNTGQNNTTGNQNTFIGNRAGMSNTVGENNVFVGNGAGENNAGGGNNVYTGYGAGQSSPGTWSNSIYGFQAGITATGSSNVIMGFRAGQSAANGNVMLGYTAGQNETGSNKLFIDNSNSTTPLIWGDFAADQLKLNGKVGIGAVTTFPTAAGAVNVSNYKLFVTGGILTDEVRVNLSAGGTWADYVFAKEYILKPLSEVEAFIAKNKHLPNVPSAQQVKEEGIALGEMAKIQQEKIEELTLYLIQQNKEIQELKAQVNALAAKKQ